MESIKDCRVTYPPMRILQRKRNQRLERKKKDNCGSEMFEKRGDGIDAQVEGLCSDRSRGALSVLTAGKEEGLWTGVGQVDLVVGTRGVSHQIACIFSVRWV